MSRILSILSEAKIERIKNAVRGSTEKNSNLPDALSLQMLLITP